MERLESLEVLFSVTGSRERRGAKASGLTEDGLFLASNQLWPPGTALTLLLALPGERLPTRISGEVVWARTQGVAGMFVRFTEPVDHPARVKLHRRTPAPARAGAKPSE